MVEAFQGEIVRRRVPGVPAGVAMVALLAIIVVVSTAVYFGTKPSETFRPLTAQEQQELNDQYEQGHADSMIALRHFAYIPTPFHYLNARGHHFQWNTSMSGWGLSDEQSKEILATITPFVEKWSHELTSLGSTESIDISNPCFDSLPQVIHQEVETSKEYSISKITFKENAEMEECRAQIDRLIEENLNEEQRAARAANATEKEYHPEEMNWYVIRYDGRTLLVREFRGQSVGYPAFNTPWPWNALEKQSDRSL